MVVGKFIDRVMMTLKSGTVKGMDDMGEDFSIGLNGNTQGNNTKTSHIHPSVRFKEHLNYIKDLYERVILFFIYIK
jgi:hypothetical protein